MGRGQTGIDRLPLVTEAPRASEPVRRLPDGGVLPMRFETRDGGLLYGVPLPTDGRGRWGLLVIGEVADVRACAGLVDLASGECETCRSETCAHAAAAETADGDSQGTAGWWPDCVVEHDGIALVRSRATHLPIFAALWLAEKPGSLGRGMACTWAEGDTETGAYSMTAYSAIAPHCDTCRHERCGLMVAGMALALGLETLREPLYRRENAGAQTVRHPQPGLSLPLCTDFEAVSPKRVAFVLRIGDLPLVETTLARDQRERCPICGARPCAHDLLMERA